MAHGQQVVHYAQRHGRVVLTIEDVVHMRRRWEHAACS